MSSSPRQWGANVVGFHHFDFGIGTASRLLTAALDAREIPVLPLHDPELDRRLRRVERSDPRYPCLNLDMAGFPVNIVCMNGNHLLMLVESSGTGLFDGRYTIALWFWETDRFPDRWLPALRHLDEVWAPSEYVARVMASAASVPVNRIRLPVTAPIPGPFDRERYGIPADDFLFLYLFEYGSSGRRKNPLGLIDAFDAAFPPGSGASLLLKTSFSENEPEHAGRVVEAAARHRDVHVADGRVTRAEKDAIVGGCDCYVSLHRSEGFGLTQAEAMALGKPVIATGYGGSMEYMNPENAYLVRFELVEIGEGELFYPADDRWADPDIDHAARLMREVFEHPEAARGRGRRGAEHMRSAHSPQAAGRIIGERLDAIREALPGSRDERPASPLTRLRQMRLERTARRLRRRRERER